MVKCGMASDNAGVTHRPGAEGRLPDAIIARCGTECKTALDGLDVIARERVVLTDEQAAGNECRNAPERTPQVVDMTPPLPGASFVTRREHEQRVAQTKIESSAADRRISHDIRHRSARRARIALAAVAAVVVLVPATAQASGETCPAGGVDTTGMSGAELQVASLRNDLATACADAQANANNLHDDLFVVVGAIVGAGLIPSILKAMTAGRG